MKRFESTKRVSTCQVVWMAALLWCCLCFVSAPAQAGWQWVHGNGATIQFVNRLDVQMETEYVWNPVERAGINSHQAGLAWCLPGWYIVALDLDQDAGISAHDSPVIGQVLCAKTTEPAYRFGWGLDFVHQPGQNNWIHFSIPSPADKRVARIGLRFATNSDWAKVTDVHVWNADVPVKAFQGAWFNGTKDIVLDLDAPVKCDRGLGISVGIQATTDPIEGAIGPYRFQFFGAGADFVD